MTTISVGSVGATAPRAAADRRWWLTPFGMFQTNLREVDADLDVERVLDYIQAHGADTWLVNAGGILSFYPTELPFQTRNPYLDQRPGGDLLGDALAGARARGLRLMARMDFSKVSARIAAEHPEWCYVSPTGQQQEYSGLVSVCPSGQYYQQKTFEVLDEVIARYPVDGFFFNWFGFNEVDYSKVYNGVCQCLNCRRAFQLHSGENELPSGPTSPNYAAWQVFASHTIHDLTDRLRAHIAQRRPQACLLGRTADIVFHEANNALGRPLWHHATSEAVSVARAYRPDVPVLVNSVTFMDMPYRMAGEQPEHFAQYLVQAISRGANPSTYIMGTPGQIPYPCLPVAAELTRFHHRWRDVYDGMRPSATTALIRPDALVIPATDYQRSRSEFRGLYTALQELHVPFDVVPQEGLVEMAATGNLSRYAVLLAPDLGNLATETAQTLDGFVSGGGRLVATGSTGLGSGEQTELACLAAQRQLASTTKPELLWSTYIAPTQQQPALANIYPGPIVPVYGAYHFCEWKPDAEHRRSLLARAPFGPPEKAYGNVQVDHPGYVVFRHGRGRSVTIPWTIGRTYHDLGLSVARDLLAEVLTELQAGDEAVSATVAEQVELTVHQTRERTVVHLINMSGARRTNFGPPVPVRNGVLHIAGAPASASAHALVSDSACAVTHDGDTLRVQLPDIDLFEVIVIGDPNPLTPDARYDSDSGKVN
ncbi:MAG TPA: alpha-amylase family protein [Chloroflexota bacterium]|nr:alpha-amylase family protein [Chloroflexota bacterium]